MRKALFALCVCCATIVSAQNMSVSSFKLLENDLTANTMGTMRRDQNGEVAALIKVVTTGKGFVFDGGMTGIVDTKQEIGEVWVYVPHGIKRVTIRHDDLGVLRDYYFPIPIEKARTYEMVLTTGKVETIVHHAVNKQFVIFNVNPADAVVELDGEVLTVDGEGYATKSMPYGTYDYRVSCANYHTAAGRVTVNGQGKAEVNVTLRPNFGWIRFDGDSEYHGAYVYIDNQRVGRLPFVAEKIKSGVHRIKVVKSMYKAYEQQVSVSENETTEVNVELVPNFATTTLVTGEDNEIWIDGERKGQGQWTGPLEIGDYVVEVKRESYRTVSEVVQIHTVGDRTIQLKSPTPIYGSLEIMSNPLRAKVYIDGVEVGETPLLKNDVLVGPRQITLEKSGYVTVNRTVDLKEDVENIVSVELKKKAEEDKPTQSAKQDVDKKSPRKSAPAVRNNSLAGWKGLFAIEYSGVAPINYGGELGIAYNGFSVSVGAKSHLMGDYGVTYIDGTTEEHQVQLLRFSAKLGYTMGLGKYIRITPQVELVYGPFCLMGKEYITGEISRNPDKEVAYLDLRAESLNRNITQFVSMRYGVVAGARIEVGTGNARIGLYATPEYLLSEGFKWNVGLVFRF